MEDIDIPPAPARTDLYYTYYGRLNEQVEETIDHVNLLWESQFEGHVASADNILKAKLPTVLDVANQVMLKFAESGKNHRLNPEAETNLRGLFNYHRLRGSLEYIKFITPMDEPNTNVRSQEDVQQAIDIIRKVAADFPELNGLKFVCIYAAKPETYECISEFDYVGVDDYDLKSQIFVNGTYGHLRSKLRSDQKTIILPGGAFGQNPHPFENFANGNSEVGMVIPFVWFGPMQPADKWVGIRDDVNQKMIYTLLGKRITGK